MQEPTLSKEQQLALRRRQKILARATAEDKTPQEQDQNAPSVFERYRNIKQQEKYTNTLLNSSKAAGLPAYLLSHFIDPALVFISFLLVLFLATYRVSGSGENGKKKGQGLAWMGQAGQWLQKFQYLEKIVLALRVGINLLLSYLLGAVLVTSFTVSADNLGLLDL